MPTIKTLENLRGFKISYNPNSNNVTVTDLRHKGGRIVESFDHSIGNTLRQGVKMLADRKIKVAVNIAEFSDYYIVGSKNFEPIPKKTTPKKKSKK